MRFFPPPCSCALLACVGLAACGGSGDHVASTPPPAAVASYDSFATLDRTVTLATSSTAVSFLYDPYHGNEDVARDAKGGFADGAVTISYDATTKTYMLHDGTAATSWAAADRVPAVANSPATPFDTYRRDTGSVSDTVRAYRAGGSDTSFPQLSYTTFVIANCATAAAQSGLITSYRERTVYAVSGFETLRSDLPRTGTASYTTFLTGTQVESGREVGGTATLSADFGAGTVATALALSASGQAIGSFTGTAAIDPTTPHFQGDLVASGAPQGRFAGSFFGPQATEVGYAFRVQTGIGIVDGGVVGKR